MPLDRDAEHTIGITPPLPDLDAEVHFFDSKVHLADGSTEQPACGAPSIWNAGVSNTSTHRDDVTCEECGDIADERRWEQDEESRLFYAGQAAYDRAVDRDIEARRER